MLYVFLTCALLVLIGILHAFHVAAFRHTDFGAALKPVQCTWHRGCHKLVVSAAGSDSNASGSEQLATIGPTSTSEASLSAPNSPQGSPPKPKPASHKLAVSPTAALSPKSGSKRKAAFI